jgi:Tfp pilus assembly protein PilV
MTHTDNTQGGFALLITIIVLSVVLAIGLSLLEISLKQINLTITARESELAFVAANSGIECAQFSRFNREISTAFDNEEFEFACFGQGARIIDAVLRRGSNPRVYEYQTQYDVGTASGDMCVDVTVFVMDNRTNNNNGNYNFSNQGVSSRSCPGNSVCTNIFSRGYNRACDAIGDRNTVQREMTAEF